MAALMYFCFGALLAGIYQAYAEFIWNYGDEETFVSILKCAGILLLWPLATLLFIGSRIGKELKSRKG